ncbi:MAG: hypothetical protein LBI99_09820 [Propionibacteriaceae bacterium]|nr:hypothetical protein [Propionibacteriaceae bacterium]
MTVQIFATSTPVERGGIPVSFSVTPEEIADFGRTLTTLSDGCPTAKQYCDSWVRAAGQDDAIFANFCSTANQVANKINERLDSIRAILEASGTELGKLASYYVSQEDSRAASIDASYSGYDKAPNYIPTTYASPLPNNPVDAISGTPSDADPIPPLGDLILHGAGVLLSPTGWVLTIIDLFCEGKNPLDDALKWVAGDWNEASQGSEALASLANFHGSLANEVHDAKKKGMQSWEGHSAEAANSYFNRLVDALDDLVPEIKGVSGDFHAVAYGMWSAAQSLSSILSTLSDLLIAAAISWAVTGSVSWTGIGGLIGTAISSAETVAVVAMWIKAYDVWNTMITCVDAFAGACAGYLGAIHSIDRIQEVGSVSASYDNPFVS